jgi:photosystem II stability/assembly factor-like uncharacterized protein
MLHRFFLLLFILFIGCAPEYLVSSYNTIRYENMVVSTKDDITAIEFLDQRTGFIGTSNGKLFKTSNQGISWISTTSPTEGFINAITFVTSSVGFVGTSKGLFKTINAGSSWVLVDQNPVVSISFPSPNIGYAVSQNYYIKTSDGGDYWTEGYYQSFPYIFYFRNNLHAISFKDDQNGSIVGTSESIYKTNNGGISWSLVSEGTPLITNNDCRSIGSSIFTVGTAGSLKRSVDKLSFDQVVEEFDFELLAVDFYNNIGVTVGENSIILGDLSSTSNWHYFYAPDGSTIPHYYLDVSFVTQDTFIAVGKDGVISKFKLP